MIQPVLRHSTVFALVVFLIGAGFLQNYYNESRSRDPLTGKLLYVPKKKKTARTAHQPHPPSLLSADLDRRLERDPQTNQRYHLIFSTDCSPYQHWQSYLVFFTAMKVQQPGIVTRIASGCNATEEVAIREWFEQDVAYLSTRFKLHLTPYFSGVQNEAGETVADYKFFNKPFGLKHWLEHSTDLGYFGKNPDAFDNDVVILIDPDMGLLRPITSDFSNPDETIVGDKRKDHRVTDRVSPGHPVAQVYGFGTQWARLDLAKIAGEDSPAVTLSHEDGFLYYPAGPPYLATVPDMHRIAEKWTEFVPGVYEQYPHLLAEMFAFCIAAAHLELPFQLVNSLMISKTDAGGEGWPLIDNIPNAETCSFAKNPDPAKHPLPSVVHLCQRYFIGKEWFFSKRKVPGDLYDCEVPLFDEPPDDVALLDFKWAPGGQKKSLKPYEANREAFMVCYLFRLLNDAATFYKSNACPANQRNLQKERNLVQYLHEHRTKKS